MTTEQVAHTALMELPDWKASEYSAGDSFNTYYVHAAGPGYGGRQVIVAGIHEESLARLIAAAPELLACLKEALELIQEDIDNRDGRDNFGMCCGNCDGAIPVEHSFGCRAKAVISKAEGGK